MEYNTKRLDAQTGFFVHDARNSERRLWIWGERGAAGSKGVGKDALTTPGLWSRCSKDCSIRMFLHKYNSFTHKPMSPSLIHVKYFVIQENNKLGRKVTAIWHNQLLLRGYRVSNAMGQGSPKSMVKACFTIFKKKYNFIMCKHGLSSKLWTTKLSFDMNVI